MNTAQMTTRQLNDARAANGRKRLEAFLDMSHEPMKINEALLMQILRDNKDTEYGRKYGFDTIDSIEEYQRRVPVTVYDDYALYIERTVHQNENDLMTAYPFILFCQTSGTMGIPKILPMSQKAVELQNTWNSPVFYGILDRQLNDGGAWRDGRSLLCMTCGLTDMKFGKRFGALSSIMMEASKPVLPLMTAVPEESVFPEGSVDPRYIQARFGLADAEITTMQCTYLCYVVETVRYIENNWEMLVRDIEKGTIDESIRLPENVRESLLNKIVPMPERAAQLRGIFEQGFDTPFIPRVWPKLKAISGIGTGSFEMYDELLRERYIDESIQMYYPGISATEGLFSIPLQMNCKNSALVPCSMFYEFLPLDAGDDFSQIVTMDKLEEGRDYEIILTGVSGMYRYRMRDCIRVMGFHNKLPLIRFQYRIEQTVDIMGEHTTEASLTLFARETARELGFELLDCAVYPDRDADVPKYVYFFEVDKLPEGVTRQDIQRRLWKKLRDGVCFITSKMDEGRCTVDIHILQNETFWLYKDILVMRGANPAQIKPLRIVANEFQRRFLFGLIEKEYE